MKVAFLSDAFAASERYGLGRYARELHAELNAIGVEASSFCTNKEVKNSQANKLPWGRKLHALCWATLGWPRFERWVPEVDLVHSVEMSYPVATKKPWVVTIHDLGPLTHPDYFAHSRPWLIRRALNAAAQRADAIICVSEATAEAVETMSKVPVRDRLHVIYEGVSSSFSEPTCQSHCMSIHRAIDNAPYLLWTGSLSPRKNLVNVVRAFELAARKIPHHLVLTGNLHWEYNETLRSIRDSPLKTRIHRVGFVDEQELQALYQGADAFIYTSLMEGFGLPILEAMASGCPVICSNISSMPEVAGSAAIQVDPHKPSQISSAILQLTTSPDYRETLTACGKNRVLDFTWNSCARRVKQVYTDLVGE